MTERGIEPGCTVFSAAEIRVVLLPVGDVPQEIWDEYASLISHHTQMQLSVMRSFYHEQQKSPFTQLPWSTGALHFKYLQGCEAEPAVANSKRSALSASHKVLGVIGICHCPTHNEINDAYALFEQTCKMYPDAFTVRCFAFEPSNDHVAQDGKSNAFLIMFPPDDEKKLEYHLGVMMNDFAACLLMELEKWMLNASPAMVNTSTWLDSSDFSVPVSTLEEVQKRLTNDEEVTRKRRHGRLRKAMGDHCLLAGSPQNAAEHFSTAIDLSRAVNDFVWLGAASEGYICAKVLQALLHHTESRATTSSLRATLGLETLSPESPAPAPRISLETAQGMMRQSSQKSMLSACKSFAFGDEQIMSVLRSAAIYEQIRELFVDAQIAYRKPRISFLQIELDLKLARLLAGIGGREKKKEVLDLVTETVEAAKLLPKAEDRLIATMESAEICSLVGAGRKQALLLWRAVELSRALDKQNKRALALVREALLPVLTKPGGQDPSRPEVFVTKDEQKDIITGAEVEPVHVNRGWAAVHCGVLEALLGASTRTMSHQEAWRAAATILCHHANRLSEDRQKWLLDTLKVASKYTDKNVLRGPGPPPMLKVVSMKAPAPWLRPIDVAIVAKGSDIKKGPFIFSPLDARDPAEKKTVRWVCGEECEVHVEVSNPCTLPISVDRMSLAGFYEDEIEAAGNSIPYPKPQDYTRWKGTAVTVWLPGHTPPSKLALSGLAKVPGRLVITGCYVQMFGVTWHQPWSQQGTPGDNLREEIIVLPKQEGLSDPFAPVTVEIVPPLQLLRGSLEGDRLVWVKSSAQASTTVKQPVRKSQPAAHGAEPSALDQESKEEEDAARKGKPKHLEMVAFEGEVFIWKLRISNIGLQPITSIVTSVTVSKPPSEKAKTSGTSTSWLAYRKASRERVPLTVEVGTEKLQTHLPLAPSASFEVPVSVRIGDSPDDAVCWQVSVKLEYLGQDDVEKESAEDADQETKERESNTAPEPRKRLGRELTLPVQVTVRRNLRIQSCEFYRHDQVVEAASDPPGLQTISQGCMELAVANSGDNWYKARIGPWAEQGEGSGWVQVPPLGGKAVVRGVISIPEATESTSEAPSIASYANILVKNWGLHWEQLPDKGSDAAQPLPSLLLSRGFLPLEAGMVTAALHESLLTALSVPHVELEFRAAALSDTGELTTIRLDSLEAELQANECALREGAIRTVSALSCSSAVGSVLHLELALQSLVPRQMELQANVECVRRLGVVRESNASGTPKVALVSEADEGALDFMAVGTMNALAVPMAPRGLYTHRFGVCFLVPGVFQISCTELCASQPKLGDATVDVTAPERVTTSARHLYVVVS